MILWSRKLKSKIYSLGPFRNYAGVTDSIPSKIGEAYFLVDYIADIVQNYDISMI